jgi:hypothetical protein
MSEEERKDFQMTSLVFLIVIAMEPLPLGLD